MPSQFMLCYFQVLGLIYVSTTHGEAQCVFDWIKFSSLPFVNEQCYSNMLENLDSNELLAEVLQWTHPQADQATLQADFEAAAQRKQTEKAIAKEAQSARDASARTVKRMLHCTEKLTEYVDKAKTGPALTVTQSNARDKELISGNSLLEDAFGHQHALMKHNYHPAGIAKVKQESAGKKGTHNAAKLPVTWHVSASS